MSAYVGVDLGGTAVKAAIACGNGEILEETSRPTDAHEGPEAVLERIAEMVNTLAKSTGALPKALGMGVPGLADLAAGITKFLPNLPTQWRDVPVGSILSPQVACPVYLLNDVRTATLGELTFGFGKNVKTMLFFSLGTGIGGGVVVDGELRLGPLGAAGELGHQTILPNGPRCGCGNHGCLETLASATAMAAEGVRLMLSGQAPKLHELVSGNAGHVTTKKMAQAARQGDDRVTEAIERAATYLGIGASNLITALHPELVVLGGGAAAIGDILFDKVKETIRQRVRMLPVDDIRVEPSMLGNQAGVLGGVALAMKSGLI